MNNKFESENSYHYISFGEILLRVLNGAKKHWWLIAILAGILSLAFVFYSYRNYVPQYKATATFTVSPRDTNVSSYSSTSSSASTLQLEKTFPYIITSAPLTNVVTEDLGLSSMPGSITATAVEDTNLFTITVTSSDYEMAYNVLKSVINNYPSVAEYVVGATDIVLVVPPSASSEPVNSVSYRNWAVIGAGAGIIMALVIILILEMFNVTVRRPDDIESLLNNERIGSIVKVVRKKSSNATDIISIDNVHADGRFKESIFSIRNKIIKKCKDNKINSIMIASTATDEGKTTISANLAVSFAKKHYRTVIIDCDLRNPSLRKQMSIPDNCSLGIVDVITGKCNLEDAIVKLKKNGLYVLPGTEAVSNASELMGSKQLAELIEALERMFDYVIIDVPPVGIVADALELKDTVGGLVFVVRQDYVKVNRILDSISLFGSSKIQVLGCIFSMASGVFGSKGYGRYGYNSYGSYGMYGSGYYRGKYGYGRYGGYENYSDDSNDDGTEDFDQTIEKNESN